VVGLAAEELRRVLGGETDADGLLRRLLGLARATAESVIEQAQATGRSAADLLASGAEAVAAGEAWPVIESVADPLEAAERGELAGTRCRLLPWTPAHVPDGLRALAADDAAATAGWYFEALHVQSVLEARAAARLALLRSELARTARARAAVSEDLAEFADPERHRIFGEALLAGLRVARRAGDHVLVPDPYAPAGGGLLSVPVPAGRSLQDGAAEQFRLHRRARRGLEAAERRAGALESRRVRIEALVADYGSSAAGASRLDELERRMRDLGLAVGLERARGTRPLRGAAAGVSRAAGIRLLHASDGSEILAGRGGRENDRLTFKLAGPDDFWFHAQGVAGAHVVVRNPTRAASPPHRLCAEAAAVAAWYSDARLEPQADVLWTRRKYVRRKKGSPPGTVTIKRSSTVRVRPGLPREGAEEC
jgi:hypothetical protein